MSKLCWHDWYVFKSLTDNAIKTAALNPKVDSDLCDSNTMGPRYKEKICLKCKKYIDEIEKRHRYWVSKKYKINVLRRKRKQKAEFLRSGIKDRAPQ